MRPLAVPLLTLCFACMVTGACSSATTREEEDDASLEELFVPGEELPGGEGTNTLLFGQNALSRHVENASAESELAFFSGNGFFNQPWVEAPSSTEARDGLGPLFNARSCAACHFRDGRGSPPLGDGQELTSMLLRLSVGEDEDEMPRGDEVYGGQVQPYAIADVPAELDVSITYEELNRQYPDGTAYTLLTPTYDLIEPAHGPVDEQAVVSPRVAPAMHGLGLLEAIPEERLMELADEHDDDADGISGRLRYVPMVGRSELVPGRFGWKCEQPTVRQQAAGAFLGDMGLTTSLFPDGECTPTESECAEQPSGGSPEVSDDILDRVVAYSLLVGVPARDRAGDPEVLEGKRLFLETGCADCHTPSHVTGDHELPELRHQTIYPYTDLLLHDMGEELADGDGATRIQREWRTPPLWSLRFYPVVNGHDRLLHDGRARGVEEAILWHDGEANAARTAFLNLSEGERERLIDFVESL